MLTNNSKQYQQDIWLASPKKINIEDTKKTIYFKSINARLRDE